MSHRLFTAAAVLSALLSSTVARADFKAGYVDLQRALLEVDEGKAAKGRLQHVLDQKQKDIDKEQEGLRKEKELLDKQASAMSEETRIQKQTDLQKKLFDLAQRWEKGKAEMQNQERKELSAIFAKMDPIIAEIAQREGLTMMLEKTDSGLVWAPQSLDYTNELVRRFNDQSKKGGGPKADAPRKDAPKK